MGKPSVSGSLAGLQGNHHFDCRAVRRPDLRRDVIDAITVANLSSRRRREVGVFFPRDLLARAERSVREPGEAHQNSPGVGLTRIELREQQTNRRTGHS